MVDPITIVTSGVLIVASVVAAAIMLTPVPEPSSSSATDEMSSDASGPTNEEQLFGEPIAKDPDSLDDFPDLICRDVRRDVHEQLAKSIIDEEPLLVLLDIDEHERSDMFNHVALEQISAYELDEDADIIDVDTGTTDIYVVPRTILMDESIGSVKLSICPEDMLIDYANLLQDKYRHDTMAVNNSIDYEVRLVQAERLAGESEPLSEMAALNTV